MEIAIAEDFPKTQYMEVVQRLSVYLSRLGVDAGTVPGFAGYAGGWNALIIRFRAADEYCSAAATLLARNYGSMNYEERYQQQRALFGFFANAMSAVESCCFAVYHICKMKEPELFAADDRAVTVSSTAQAVQASFPGTGLDSELTRLVRDAAWIELGRIRNMLVHRVSPGTTIHMSTAGAPPPPPAEWTGLGIALEPSLVSKRRAWLTDEIIRLVETTLAWVEANF